MKNYRVTPRAREDLKNIGRYTEQKWGKLQRNTYLKQLELRFEWLAENPLSGRNRVDVCQGLYSFPQAEHVVFYRFKLEKIEIISVLHQEMDVSIIFLNIHNNYFLVKHDENIALCFRYCVLHYSSCLCRSILFHPR